MIRFEEITPKNWRTDLTVAPHQVGQVAPPEKILARAYAYRRVNACAYLICEAHRPVGMLLYHDYEAGQAYDISQFFIDQRYQGQGYGAQALACLLDKFRAEKRHDKVILCITAGNHTAQKFYEKAGFVITDPQDDEEIAMHLFLD